MKHSLTKRTVEAAKSGDRDLILWHSELKGFGCKVTPKGKRVYFSATGHVTGNSESP